MTTLHEQIALRMQRDIGLLFPSAALYACRGTDSIADVALQCTPHDRFDVASLTKVCATTPAILQLCARGELALDAAASEWLPALRTVDKSAITIRQLLTHTSGLPAWRPFYARTRNRNDVAGLIAAEPLQSRPGSQRCYSDLGFLLLGFLIEAVAHQQLDRYCTQQLYRPLGLTHSGFAPQLTTFPLPTSVGNRFEQRKAATLRGWNFSDWRTGNVCGEPNDGNAHYAMGNVAGHAGLFATAHDIATVASAQLPNAQRDIGIPRALRDAMWTADANGQGLGWWMNAHDLGITGLPAGAGAHFGFTGCCVCADPATETVLVLLTNKQQMGLNADGRYPDLRPLVSDLLNYCQKL